MTHTTPTTPIPVPQLQASAIHAGTLVLARVSVLIHTKFDLPQFARCPRVRILSVRKCICRVDRAPAGLAESIPCANTPRASVPNALL